MQAGRFELRSGEETRAFAWSEDAGNLVFCRHDPKAAGGDYVWIRLAARPEQDGDAGPRLDIDLCRLTAIADGATVAAMDAGQHGSRCRAEAGVAVWWHEGAAAFNNGASADADCSLTLDRDDDRISGQVRCGPLRAHEGDDQTSMAVEGSFSCTLTAMAPAG